jgi:hypothetical protein
MGEKKFTLIELNLQGDHQFGPRAIDDALPFGEKREAADLEGEEELESEPEAEEEEGGGKGAIGALIALVVLVALGVAAKKYTEDDEAEEFPEDEQPDVVVT